MVLQKKKKKNTTLWNIHCLQPLRNSLKEKYLKGKKEVQASVFMEYRAADQQSKGDKVTY